MIYLYAYTNHKADLDALRRMGALWKYLERRGVEAELLVNDYRAQLAGRELGLPLATTIETLHDIDAVASYGDRVVIDTPEELPPSLARHFSEHFARWIRVLPGGGEPIAGEEIFDPCSERGALVEQDYFEAASEPKEPRTLLIFRDTDPKKELLEFRAFFEGRGVELYWGVYFFVKYEEVLEEIFGVIHESEEYATLLKSSARIVTAMPQTALEAAAAGAEVLFLRRGEISPACEARLRALGIATLRLGDEAGWRDAWEALSERQTPSSGMETLADRLLG